MTRLSERAAALSAVLAILASVMILFLGRRTQLLVCPAILPQLILAAATGVLVFVRLRLARLAAEEYQDRHLQNESNTGLFPAAAESDAFTIARSREQFEKYFVPAIAPMLALAQTLLAWRLWKTLPWGLAQPRDHLIACAFLAGTGFVFFLFSRYLMGLSRNADFKLLRGPAIALALVSFCAFAGAASSVASFTVWPPADTLLARALVIALGALAAENILSFLAALYSPRRSAAFSTAYESRLASCLADPATWTRGLAQTLDYQFGYKVSDTGLFKLLRRVALPLVMFQLLILYIGSCFVFLGPEEEAVLERFGRPVENGWHLTSGCHMKAPWPFETVRRFPARRILTTHIGYDRKADARKTSTLLWTVPHFKSEDNFIVPSAAADSNVQGAVPVNLVSMNIPIEYRITNILNYAYSFADPEAMIRQLAYRSLTHEAAGIDLFDLLGHEREAAGARLKSEMQRNADQLGLGVSIEFVALQGVHPPVAVASAFQSVVGAIEEREAHVLVAKAYAASSLPGANAAADKLRSEADAYRSRRKTIAAADAAQFEKRMKAYDTSPAVFKSRFYLGSLRDALATTRKYIVDAPASREVLYFNFEDKSSPELFDLAPAPQVGESK